MVLLMRERRISAGALIKSTIDLHVDRMTLDRVGGFHEDFAQGGVGMDVAGDLGGGDLHELGQAHFRQQFGHVWADQVRAQNFAVFGVGDDLDKARALRSGPGPCRWA